MTEREHDMRQKTSDGDRGALPSATERTVRTGRGRRRGVEMLLVVAVMLFVGWFYHWTVWANNGFEDWGDNDYYRLLVRGWKKGQLSLDRAPTPELLALADPYDPAQN